MQSIQIISEECIKPSLPTPHTSIKLSLLDQIAEEIYSLALFCYSTTSTTALQELPWKLKTSLSKVLNQFYPLAGRIEIAADGILQVNCNNEGIVFIEACSKTDLTTFLLSPPIHQFRELLPVKTTTFKHSEPLLLLQFTKFLNGYVLGVSMSHVIADGGSADLFLHRWAETARGIEEDGLAMPCFTSASTFFPPKPLTIAYQEPKEPLENSELVVKRFVLSSSSIRRLRESAYKRSEQKRPTRVEAVTALVIRSVMRAAFSLVPGKERREMMRKMGVSVVSVSRDPIASFPARSNGDSIAKLRSRKRWLWAKPVGRARVLGRDGTFGRNRENGGKLLHRSK